MHREIFRAPQSLGQPFPRTTSFFFGPKSIEERSIESIRFMFLLNLLYEWGSALYKILTYGLCTYLCFRYFCLRQAEKRRLQQRKKDHLAAGFAGMQANGQPDEAMNKHKPDLHNPGGGREDIKSILFARFHLSGGQVEEIKTWVDLILDTFIDPWYCSKFYRYLKETKYTYFK